MPKVTLWDHVIYNPHHGNSEDPSFGLTRCAELLAFAGNWVHVIIEQGGLLDCSDDMQALAGLDRILSMVKSTIEHIEQAEFTQGGCTCACHQTEEEA